VFAHGEVANNHTCHRKGDDRYYIFCRVDPN